MLCMTPSLLFAQSEVKYGGYFFTFNDGQFVMPLRENPRRYLEGVIYRMNSEGSKACTNKLITYFKVFTGNTYFYSP